MIVDPEVPPAADRGDEKLDWSLDFWVNVRTCLRI